MAEFEDPATRLDRLISQTESRFQRGFREAVASITDAVALTEIAALIEAGRLETALTRALAQSAPIGNLYVQGFVNGATSTEEFLNRKTPRSIRFDFDQQNPFAVRTARDNRLRLIREFNRGQREATRQAIAEGVQAGANPIQQARNFRDSIGLTRRQVRAVNNYRRLLEEGNREALGRGLRDRRFDRTVNAAIRDGRALSRQQIDTMVGRYRERYLQYRSRVIARTEAIRAVNQGRNEMYRQGIEEGKIDPANTTQEWNTSRDERVRGSHASMHGQVQPIGTPFISGEGAEILFPTDPSAPPEESIQCRCRLGTRITTIDVPAGLSVEIL